MTELPAEPFPGHPRVIFMGTPDFAVPTLKAMISHGHNVLAVVTQPDRPKGRGKKLSAPPVKELAMKHGIFGEDGQDVEVHHRSSNPGMGSITSRRPAMSSAHPLC